MSADWQIVPALVVRGHTVASGGNGNPHYPGGTLRMQAAHFRERGLDLAAYHGGTLNVSIAPARYRVVRARHTFRAVKWHPVDAAEDFSFFDVRVQRDDAPPVAGLIYHPHPETKPKHFQQPDVLELLLPFIEGATYGAELRLAVPADQIVVE